MQEIKKDKMCEKIFEIAKENQRFILIFGDEKQQQTLTYGVRNFAEILGMIDIAKKGVWKDQEEITTLVRQKGEKEN